MQVISLFPRSLLKAELSPDLLVQLLSLAGEVLGDLRTTSDASAKLAGQLSLQRELSPAHPAVIDLCRSVVLPGCERWIRHVIDREPPQGRGPWTPGRYGLQMVDLWLNVQRAGDYNPVHTHGGSFSGVLFLQVPPQIGPERFDGQLCFHGPEEWHIQSFRTGMAHYVLPVPGDLYIFPAWQPHSVAPFRGEGERWSIAFNVMAIPQAQPASVSPPSKPTAVRNPLPSTPSSRVNRSLSSSRQRPGGFR